MLRKTNKDFSKVNRLNNDVRINRGLTVGHNSLTLVSDKGLRAYDVGYAAVRSDF